MNTENDKKNSDDINNNSQNEEILEKNVELNLDNSKKLKSKNEKLLEDNLDEKDIIEDIVKEVGDDSNDTVNYEEEISNLRDEKLRILAEMDNLRKRVEKEKAESIKFGSINLARDILSPNDNLSRALANLPGEKINSEPIKNLIDGLKMVQKEFMMILEKHGVKQINALNTKFDHNLHQAVFEVETTEQEEGLVVQEIQTGYTMGDRLLRPSMVGVSKKPTKDKKKA